MRERRLANPADYVMEPDEAPRTTGKRMGGDNEESSDMPRKHVKTES